MTNIIRDKDLTSEQLEKLIEDDPLKRSRTLFNIIRILNSIEKSTSISLNGAWGTGKTVFVKQIELINESDKSYAKLGTDIVDEFRKKYRVFYYNAWANDDNEDPLESILLNLVSERKSMTRLSKEIKKQLENILIYSAKSIIQKYTGVEIKRSNDIF